MFSLLVVQRKAQNQRTSSCALLKLNIQIRNIKRYKSDIYNFTHRKEVLYKVVTMMTQKNKSAQ